MEEENAYAPVYRPGSLDCGLASGLRTASLARPALSTGCAACWLVSIFSTLLGAWAPPAKKTTAATPARNRRNHKVVWLSLKSCFEIRQYPPYGSWGIVKTQPTPEACGSLNPPDGSRGIV